METTSYACPVCGTVHEHQSERYKNYVCHECEKRASCVAHGRGVIGYNTSPMGGGFAAWHVDRGDNECAQVTRDGRVLVDGAEFRMREAYMGGTVTHPLSPFVPAAESVVWSRDGHIEWTSLGAPEPFVGYVGEKAGRRRLLGRAPSTFEWMVRKHGHDHTVSQGVEATADEARARVLEELDRINRFLADPA